MPISGQSQIAAIIEGVAVTIPVTGSIAIAAAIVPIVVTGSVALTDGVKSTYSAAIESSGIAGPVYVSYFFVIQGSPTRTIRVTSVGFSGQQTTAGHAVFALYGGSNITSSSSGPVAVSAFSHDSINPSSTAKVTAFTGSVTPVLQNPVPGRAWDVFLPAASSSGSIPLFEEQFGVGAHQAIVLRGSSQCLALTLVGGSLPGAAISAYFEWTEE